MRIVAVVAAYNEERFLPGFIEHLGAQGVEVYLIDNESTDATAEIAERYRGRGVIGVEMFPRAGVYSWRALLERKTAVAADLEADWFMHVDPDEIRLAPPRWATLADALAEVDRCGYNAVNFQEFTFVPTRESPDHDHPRFLETMRRYYPFAPNAAHQVKVWKRQSAPVDLASSGGHHVAFDGLRVYPEAFPMRHYLYLSVDHAIRKYVRRHYDEHEVAIGWHRGRARLTEHDVILLPERELRAYRSDAELDPAAPLKAHPLFAAAATHSA